MLQQIEAAEDKERTLQLQALHENRKQLSIRLKKTQHELDDLRAIIASMQPYLPQMQQLVDATTKDVADYANDIQAITSNLLTLDGDLISLTSKHPLRPSAPLPDNSSNSMQESRDPNHARNNSTDPSISIATCFNQLAIPIATDVGSPPFQPSSVTATNRGASVTPASEPDLTSRRILASKGKIPSKSLNIILLPVKSEVLPKQPLGLPLGLPQQEERLSKVAGLPALQSLSAYGPIQTSDLPDTAEVLAIFETRLNQKLHQLSVG